MAFIYCNDCGWSQDDFWSENYYPNTEVITRVLLPGILDTSKRKVEMYEDEAERMGLPYEEEEDHMSENGEPKEIEIDFRAYVGYELMRLAKKVMQQYWITAKDFENDISKRCPVCNSANLGVD